MELATQGSGGVNIPRTVQKVHGCGTWRYGLVRKHSCAGLMIEIDDIKGLFQP